MNMQKEWSSFRLTLLLYAIILIIPLTFYFVYTSFNTLDYDTKIIRKVGWLEGTTMSLTINPSAQNNQQVVKHIDEVLQDLSLWVTQNNDSEFYLGGQTLTEDLSNVMTYWDLHKKALSNHDFSNNIKENSLKWNDAVRNLTVIIENMVYLKQNKLINMFYWNLAAAMMLALLLIYLVRMYIHTQMKKHAIHDHETHLFNKKFFLAELHSTFTRSQRHENPLSLLFVSLNDFTKETYDKKTKVNIMKELGEIFTSVTRNSDIPCRYDENYFAVLLPLTDKEHALILESRLRGALKEHDFKVKPEMNFSFATTQADVDESEETFISRTKKDLTL